MQVGDFFDGRYIIERLLGRGGMGTVWLARNINTDTYWAIKEIPKEENTELELPAEPMLLKKLEHPALPRLFDILEQDGKLYMISNYIEGIPLDKKLEAEGRIAEEIVSEWAIQLCKALDYLHSLTPNPIIYRDMKPSNIILAANGTLKLIDFGIAREYKSHSGSDTVYIGTRGYAAPEQYGTGQTNAASDIYSLGVTLHHLLTGKNPTEPPFGLKPARYYVESLSEEMEGIVLKCTRENADERYQSARELLDELEILSSKYGCGLKSIEQNVQAAERGDAISNAARHTVDEGSASLRRASFKKMVITIWDNAEFGCELAYMAAKHAGGEVLLADLDLLAPKADLHLNLKKYPAKSLQGGLFGHSGIDLVMDAIGKGLLTAELLQQSTVGRKDLKNLHILTGNFRLDNYEYFSEESVPKLIDKCYRSYDITILLVNRSIYDAFTLAALLRSDLNIAAIRGDVDRLREYNTYVSFLKEKQNLPLESTKFVLFEYDGHVNMSLSEAREATQDNLLGKVAASKRRAFYRNLRGAYAARMDKEVAADYLQILARLELIPNRSAFQKLGLQLGQFFAGRPSAIQGVPGNKQ